MKLEFFRQIFENIKIHYFMKIGPVRAELFGANWRTDLKES